MSGSLSYLSTLYSSISGNSTTSDLLSTLYGTSSSATSTQADALAALSSAETNETKDVAVTASEPSVARDVAAFRAAVAGAKDTTSLLSNAAFMKVFLTSNNLSDQIQYGALARKALMSDINDTTSLANVLTDTRWKTAVQTYDFANKGLSVIQNSSTMDTLANAYAEVTWRQSLDQTTPGLSNALTFRAEASSITSVDQILGDSVMRTVVTTALGIPQQIAYQELEAQEKAITNRLDITKLQDPKFVETFTQRYLLAANDPSNSTSTTPDLTALAVQSAGLVV
jgi:hypothetical protein